MDSITENLRGWISGLSNDDYHTGPGISSSRIKSYLSKVPAAIHYELTHPNPNQPEFFKIGTAFHVAMLETPDFENQIAVSPAFDRRTKKGKADYMEFMYENAHKTVIDEIALEQVLGMAESVRNHPKAAALLESSLNEQSIYWEHESGELLKCRPDALSRAYPLIVDLKTCTDASESGMLKAVDKFKYNLSAAMYLQGVNQCSEILQHVGIEQYQGFVLICVEREPPYCCAVYEIDPSYLDLGLVQMEIGIKRIIEARENDYPGYPTAIRVLSPPPWADRLTAI